MIDNKEKFFVVITDILSKISPEWFKDHYSPIPVMKTKASYMMSVGGRDDGKTTAWLIVIMATWQYLGLQSIWMRRMAEALKPQFMRELFEKAFAQGLLPNDVKKYDGIIYRSRCFYGYWLDSSGKKILDDDPFCYTYALSVGENGKSAYDKKTLAFIVFDEFMSRGIYLPSEIATFYNAISTMVRETFTATIVMLGNTVTRDCIYFKEMGLKNVWQQKPDTIDFYRMGDSNTTVAMEYCGEKQANKKKGLINDRYFCFDNPHLQMIKSGGWEYALYPHPPKRSDKDRLIDNTAYIYYNDEIIQLETRSNDEIGTYILVHPDDDIDRAKIIYSDKMEWDKRYIHNIEMDRLRDRILFTLYKRKKWYYSDNTTGETVRAFFQNYMRIPTNEF